MENLKEAYLTDEELERLIAQVEQEPMLQAPSYLKDEILNSLSEQDEKMQQWQEKLKLLNRSQSRKQLWLYSVKVAVGAAAALVMLWITPAGFIQLPGSAMVEPPEQLTETTQPWEEQEPLSMEEWEARLKENVPQPSALSNLLQGMNQAAGKVCQGVSDTAGIFLMNRD